MECYKSSLHNFRMVECSKHGKFKNAFLKIPSNCADLDCMICNIPSCCEFIQVSECIKKIMDNERTIIHNDKCIDEFNQLVLEHLDSFVQYSDNYGDWVKLEFCFKKQIYQLKRL